MKAETNNHTHMQRVLGVICAAPNGVTTRTVLDLCSQPPGTIIIPLDRTRSTLRTLRTQGHIEAIDVLDTDNHVWIATEKGHARRDQWPADMMPAAAVFATPEIRKRWATAAARGGEKTGAPVVSTVASPPGWFTVTEASVRLGLNVTAIRAAIRDGRLTATQPTGKRYLIKDADLKAFQPRRRRTKAEMAAAKAAA